MMPEEEAAAEFLRQVVHDARAANKDHTVVPVQWVGLLLCAVGRIKYMEDKAEGIAGCKLCPEDRRFAARLILGWEPSGEGEHIARVPDGGSVQGRGSDLPGAREAPDPGRPQLGDDRDV